MSTRLEALRAKSRKTITLSDGTTAVIRRLRPMDFVKAGVPPVVFDVTVEPERRAKLADKHMRDLAEADLERRLDFQYRIIAAAFVDPPLWGEGPVGQEPEGKGHVEDLGGVEDEAFLEVMQFSGLLTEEAASRALRTFRSLASGAPGEPDSEAVPHEAERAPA